MEGCFEDELMIKREEEIKDDSQIFKLKIEDQGDLQLTGGYAISSLLKFLQGKKQESWGYCQEIGELGLLLKKRYADLENAVYKPIQSRLSWKNLNIIEQFPMVGEIFFRNNGLSEN